MLLFRFVRPERLARPEGFRSLVDFIAVLRTPTSPLLPSEWVQRAVMGWLTRTARPAAALPALVDGGGGVRARRAAAPLALRARVQQGAGERRALGARAASIGRVGHAAARAARRRCGASWCSRSCALFFRDTTQWSQLILLAVLVVVYVFNIKFLPLRGEGITFFLVNVVPFLNLVLAGFVLASIAARFIFPGVSLEGRTLWLLRSSPLPMRELLWSKFWVGTLPLLVLALGDRRRDRTCCCR